MQTCARLGRRVQQCGRDLSYARLRRTGGCDLIWATRTLPLPFSAPQRLCVSKLALTIPCSRTTNNATNLRSFRYWEFGRLGGQHRLSPRLSAAKASSALPMRSRRGATLPMRSRRGATLPKRLRSILRKATEDRQARPSQFGQRGRCPSLSPRLSGSA